MILRPLGFALVLTTLAPLASAAEFHSYVGATSRACDFISVQAAVDAASNSPDDTTFIHIARDQTYTAQQIDIDGKNVHLLGGYATCGQGTPDNTQTVLDGAGGARRSIINLRGSTRSVVFARLSLRGGDELLDDESYGGALDITQGPHARIFVSDTQFTNNSAGFGGAISLRWSDPQDQQGAYLVLGQNVTISANRGSYGGGGIYCRNGWITLQGAGSSVFQNTAGGSTESGSPPSAGAYGGGLLLNQCAARISAWGFIPAVWLNSATGPGGGIAALNPRAYVEIGNLVPSSPTRIAANHSDRFGGAFTVEQGAEVVAYDAVIEENSATQGGGAVALYNDGSAERSRFEATSHFDELPRRIACSSTVKCNVIRANTAYDGATARHGAAFRISTDVSPAEVVLDGARVTGNRGLSLVKRVSDSGQGFIEINGSLIDRNTVEENLFDLTGGYMNTTITASTFADNLIGSNTFRVSGASLITRFKLARSIVHQPGKPLVSLSSGSLPAGIVQYVLANDLTGIPTETGTDGQALNLVADPGFVDAANANYFLGNASVGVDYAPASASDLTRDGGARDIDVPAAPQRFGTQDVGAFERPWGAPGIMASPPDGRVGIAYQYQVSANSSGERVVFSADGLPPGLSIDADSGLITGTPSTAGSFSVTLRATNGLGSNTLAGIITIVPAGAINGQCGAPHEQSFTQAPSMELCAAGNATAVTGTGPWAWSCTGIGGGASAACEAYVLNEPPVILSYLLPDGVVGEPYEFTVTSDSYFQPVGYGSFGLPPGLSLDSVSGRITGIPTQAGMFDAVRILANNEVGTRTANFTVVITGGSTPDEVFSDGFE